MEYDRIRKDIIMMINEITGQKKEYVHDNFPLALDSIDFVRTLLEIEMKYNIELQDEDLIIDKYKSVDDLVEMIRRFRKGK